MKKRNKIIISITLSLALFLCSVIGIKALTIVNEENGTVDYTLKYAYNAREDGWYDAFKIYLKENGKNQYMFNGYNLKYEKMENCYIPVIDEKTGKVVDKIIPPGVSLATLEEYRNDINKINQYFTEKQFDKVININDVKELELDKISKEYVVGLFNKAISSKELTETGEYIESTIFKRVEVESDNNSQPGKYILSYTIDYGFITNVYIDFEYNDGTYLKDNYQLTLYNNDNVNNIEILQTQVIDSLNGKRLTKDIEKGLVDSYIMDENTAEEITSLLKEAAKSLEQ